MQHYFTVVAAGASSCQFDSFFKSGGVTALGGEARLFQAARDSYQAHIRWRVAKLVGCRRY